MPLPLKTGYNFHYSHFRCRPCFEMPAAEAYTDFYGLSYTISGDSICYSPEGTSVYRAGDIALIPQNVYFRTANLSETPREEILIKFTGALLSDILEVMNVKSFDELLTGQGLIIHLKKDEQEKVQQIMKEMEQEWDSYNRYSEIILKGLLNKLLVLCLEKRKDTEGISVVDRNGKEERIPDKLHEAIEYVKTHLEESPSLKETAGYLHISPSYLSKIFVDRLHTPYSAFVLNEKILYAQKFLVDSEKDMAEIAKEAGFSSNTYFSDCFKRITGMSPLQFRKAYKGYGRKNENRERSFDTDIRIRQ